MSILPKGQAKFRMAITDVVQLERWLTEHPQCCGIAMLGRSNVGKSSTINALFGSKTAVTSNTPGRTRAINIFDFTIKSGDQILGPFYLFDLPGYGFAKVSKEMQKNWQELMNVFFSRISQEVVLVNIQDARHPHQKSDQEFHQYLENFDFNTVLVFNKLDKLKKQKERAALNKIKKEILKTYKWVSQIYYVSAENKEGIEPLSQNLFNFLIR